VSPARPAMADNHIKPILSFFLLSFFICALVAIFTLLLQPI